MAIWKMGRKLFVNKEDLLKNPSAFFSGLPGNFYWKDLQGCYIDCSEGTLKTLNLDSKSFVGKTDYQLCPELQEYDKQVLSTLDSVTFEQSMTLCTGEEKVFLLTQSPWWDDNNNVVGIVGNFVDITYLKKADIDVQKSTANDRQDNNKRDPSPIGIHPRHALTDKLKEDANDLHSPLKASPSTAVFEAIKSAARDHYVLVVEDYPITAQITKTLMSGLNCQVDIAPNGVLALKQTNLKNYDLIFMDIGLPDMNGCEVTKRIRFDETRKDSNSVPIIGLTAYIDPENRQLCLEAGMNAVFTKPLAKEKIQEILNSFINKEQSEGTSYLNHEKADSHSLTGDVIDLKLGSQLVDGSKSLAREMIVMLTHNLLEDLIDLREAYQDSNWGTIQNIAHKLRGGASYCGTPRLHEACARLEDHLLTSRKTEYTDILYLQLLQEIEAVQEYSYNIKNEASEPMYY
jgi:CheY-like chemotaxis protein/HPt (histidine-containing phosphotransfer) domain-containing protein